MADSPLQKVSETTKTVTYQYPAVPGAEGFRYYADGVAVARTLDPSQLTVKFSKGAKQYRVVPIDLSERTDGFVDPMPVTPPPPTGTFGADLHKGFEWALQESPGPVVNVTSLSELMSAMSRSGAVIDGGGRTFALGGQLELPANSALTTLQNAKLTGGRIYKGNTAPWRLRGLDIALGSPEDNVKADGGFLDIDRCNIHNAPRQGILLHASDIVIRNSRIHHNGSTTNQDHGIYTAQGSRALIYNCAFYANQAYQAQLYPQYHGLLMVCCTLYGGVTRGGVVIGSENSDPTSDVRLIGCVSANAPWWGFEQYQAASNVTLTDCLGWGNGNGDFDTGSTWTVVRGRHGDPKFADPANGDFRLLDGSAAKGIIDSSLWNLVPALDIDGKARTSADAGAFAS